MFRQNQIIIAIIQGLMMYSRESIEESSDQCVASVRLPPQILVQPKENIIFEIDDEIILKCEATGVPQVKYSWKKNGVSLNIFVLAIDSGSIKINTAASFDEGYYQCFVQNPFGTAMSRIAVVKRAFLAVYPPTNEIADYTVSVGDHLKMPCRPLKTYPSPVYTWEIITTLHAVTSKTIQFNERIQQDVNGNIYFSNVELGDEQNSKIYQCSIYNAFLDLTTEGSYSRIKVSPGTPVEKRPLVEYSTPSPVIGILGKNIEFKCLFSGYPTPNVNWYRDQGSLPSNRTQILEFNTKLTITNLRTEDEGDYVCSGYNKMGYENITFQLLTQEIPTFTSADRQPHNVNKSMEENVSFYCDALGLPPPNIQWYINGYYINSTNPGPRIKISSDDKMLTVHKLCKDCGNGKTDLMVIQCNASNVHGYIYGEGYLNVLCPPEAPSRLSVSTNSSASLYITWTIGHSGDYTHAFRIELKESNQNDFVKVTDVMLPHAQVGEIYEYSLSKLKANTVYFIRISAITNNDELSASTMATGTTLGPPKMVTATAESSTTLLITWVAGYSGDFNQTFMIEYRENNQDAFIKAADMIPDDKVGETQKLLLSGLKANTKYVIRISAIIGYDNMSMSTIAVGATSSDPPKMVTVTTESSTTLLITWVAGYSGDFNQTFMIEYKENNQDAFIKAADMIPEDQVGETQKFLLSGLKANTKYVIRVSAIRGYTNIPISTIAVGTTSGSAYGIILGISIGLAILALIAIVVFVIIVRRNRRNSSRLI